MYASDTNSIWTWLLILLGLLVLILFGAGCGAGSEATTPAASSAGSSATTSAGSNATTSADSGVLATTQALLFVQSDDLDAVAVKTANFSMSRGEIVYMLSVFTSNLIYYGVDTSQSLREQAYPAEEGVSWYDILLEETLAYAREMLVFCEAAKARGYSLDQEDRDTIAELKASAETNAADMGWDVDTYFQQIYGTNIGWKHMEGIVEKSLLAQKVKDEYSNRDYTDAEREEEFQKNTKHYGLIDYYNINLGDGEGIPTEVVDKAKEAMKGADSLEAFTKALSEYLEAVKESSEIEAAGGLEAYTAQYLEACLRKGIVYSEADFFNWAFGEEAKEGDVYLLDTELTQTTYAYYLLKKPYKDEAPLVDVRHILFKIGEGAYATAEEARAKAEEIYQAWQSEGASEERFIELCAEYSGDGNAKSGGIYSDVYQGRMVETFDNWCFDASRKPGDHGLVDTSYGTHMMYFVGGRVSWEASVDNGLISQALDEIYEQQHELTPMETIQENLDSINW